MGDQRFRTPFDWETDPVLMGELRVDSYYGLVLAWPADPCSHCGVLRMRTATGMLIVPAACCQFEAPDG